MKKLKRIFLFLIFSIFTLSFSNAKINVNAEIDYSVDGGLYEIDFNETIDLNNFSIFSEHDQLPYISEGTLYFRNTCEQKVIFKNHKVSDYYMAEVDIMPLVKKGRIDCGFYLQASSASNKLDGIKAYNLNVEHDINSDSFYLKLHQFNNGWLGAKVEIPNNKYIGDSVHLKVVVKEGVLYAFLYDNETPTLTYNIGVEDGYIGFRSFRSPNKIDNFRILSNGITLNTTKLNEKILEAEELVNSNKYTESTASNLNELLLTAKDILANSKNGAELDEMISKLNKSISLLKEAHTYEVLQKVLVNAKSYLTLEAQYTKNSFESLKTVISYCEQLNESSTEDEISYWTNMLQHRIDNLIKYKEDK